MKNLTSLIASTISTLYGNRDFPITLSVPPKSELGEYCFGVFGLAKSLGKAPGVIAEEIAKSLGEDTDHFKEVNAVHGYVNISLTTKVWMNILGSLGENTKIGGKKDETIVVDYIGMNVGKPPHIGHICTPILGQSIINILRYRGYTVISDSHIGDWGLLFGKLIVGYKKYGNREKLYEDAITHLLDIYISINNDAETDISLEEDFREAFRRLSLGERDYVELWSEFTSASIETNKKILSLMHIHQDYDIGESFYEGLPLPKIGDHPPLTYDMNSIVSELIEKGIAKENEDGSVGVIFPEGSNIPSTILRKKDGTNLYLTSDLAAIKYRLTNGWNPRKILYFVDVRQSLHFKQVFMIAKMAWPDLTERVDMYHIANGAIILPEGAMSTRKGNIIRLDALIEEGIKRVREILEEKQRNLSEEDIREIAIGAIKYSYLAQDRERDVVFTWDKALSFEGNSGPYIQYATVRAKKIAELGMKNDTLGIELSSIDNFSLSTFDIALIRALAQMEEVLENTITTYKPHHLALYAYDIAVCFNSFYVHTPKILEEKDPITRSIRLNLVRHTAKQMELILYLLGIHIPSEM